MLWVMGDRTKAGANFCHKVDQKAVLEDADVALSSYALAKCANEFAPGLIAEGVDDPVDGVSTFTREVEAAAVSVELDAPVDQFGDACGAIVDQFSHDLGAVHARSGAQGVVKVSLRVGVIVAGSRDSALGVSGGGFSEFVFAKEDDLAESGCFDGSPHPRDATSDNQNIGEDVAYPTGIEVRKVSSRVESRLHDADYRTLAWEPRQSLSNRANVSASNLTIGGFRCIGVRIW